MNPSMNPLPPLPLSMSQQPQVVHCAGCQGCSWGKFDIFLVVGSLLCMVGIQLVGFAILGLVMVGGCVTSSDAGRDAARGFIDGMKGQ